MIKHYLVDCDKFQQMLIVKNFSKM